MKDIVLGAGITGLTVAKELKDCIVLEKESQIGGLAKTFCCDGFRFDLGGHRFFSKDASINHYFNSLLSGELITVERKSKIYKNGIYITYPLNVTFLFQENIFNLLSFFGTYVLRKVFRRANVLTFSDYVTNQFGDSIYRHYFKRYTEKVLGISCKNLSADWAKERIQDISFSNVIRSLVSRCSHVKSFVDKFSYPKHGIGSLCEKLSEGLNIRLQANVVGFKKTQSRIEAVILEDGESIGCHNVISTIPITDLVLMLEPPPEVKEASAKLKYRSIILVFLAYAREQIFKWHWIYVPGREIFGRIHEPKNWSTIMAPPGKTGLCLEIFCNNNDPVWSLNDEDIVKKCIEDLWFKGADEVILSKVVRVKNAYPIYFCDYKNNLKIINDFLSRYRNLFVVGRTGRYAYLNMDGCIKEALDLAKKLKAK